MNAQELRELPDEELAKREWPQLGRITGPDAILIREEWKRRRRREQAKANRVSVFLGGSLTISGAIVGALLAWLLK